MATNRQLRAGIALLAALATPAAAQEQPFGEWANEFREEHGLTEASPEGLTMQEVLDSEIFARVQLGGFDLRIPTSGLANGKVADQFQLAATVAVDAQAAWFEWREPGREDAAQIAKDWKTLHKWVQGWSAGKLGRAQGGEAGSLLDELGANDKVREAQTRLRDLTRPDEETIARVGDLNVVVFLPQRRDFLHFLAFAGWLDARQRGALWNDAALGQSQAWFGWTQLVCLEFAMLPADPNVPFAGSTQNLRQKTGQAQYMADRLAALMLRREFWRHGTHFFETALGANVVIAAVGENDLFSGEWKLEYKTSGARTLPYERFVPGGNPNGGTLPARKAGPGLFSGNMTAVSRWRRDAGEGYFVEVLRDGQKDGAKLASKQKDLPLRGDKTAHFPLSSAESRETQLMTAPFLGVAAEGKELPPNDFLDDYEDFFRAYRSGFLYWLQTRSAGSEDASAAKFAELCEAHAHRKLGKPLDEICEAVYGVPLSHENGEVDSLEWRYLAWLSKGK